MTAYAMMLWEPISTPSSPLCPSLPAVTVTSSSSYSRALYPHEFALQTRKKLFFPNKLSNEEEEHCTMILWKSVFVVSVIIVTIVQSIGSRMTLSPSCRALDHVWHCHHRASRHWITCDTVTIVQSIRSRVTLSPSGITSLDHVWHCHHRAEH